jgi:2-dehydropantoate 2-reductase
MRLLIFGAGVLGSFYAAKLLACGHEVTVLACGRRAAQLRTDGLVVQEYGRNCLRARIRVIETLEPEASYDYVLVLVRNDQVESVLPLLTANKATPSLVFMFNNLAGPQRLVDLLGHDRVVLGFPGAAGERAADGSVVATVLPALIQKTTVGELDGRSTSRIRALAAALNEAGFPTTISSQMDAWLKTHVALVSPIADAFYAASGDLKMLADSRPRVIAMVCAIRQAFSALRVHGIPVTPAKLRGIELLPEWLLVGACQWALRSSYADLIVARHATVAREEMAVLSGQLHELVVRSAGVAKSHWSL